MLVDTDGDLKGNLQRLIQSHYLLIELKLHLYLKWPQKKEEEAASGSISPSNQEQCSLTSDDDVLISFLYIVTVKSIVAFGV
ncbi:hypothetical protein NPIL_269971 [Nephila pilipes]|uniref:Uncharacterized protein n=1 Tax=Nephila pilipes TaxID=299642 RepID=A0A8X6TMZ7_NEPPI|nr:hypothetical protein NPIL_269971 [Nephila pilipes]